MSFLCGYLGDAPPDVLDRLIGAAPHRGVATAQWRGPAVGFAVRGGSLLEGPAVTAVAGVVLPAGSDGAEVVGARLADGDLSTLDGGFAAARWSDGGLELVVDPSGLMSLYVARAGEVTYFATELKALLAVTGVDRGIDRVAVQHYLVFSFVPGARTPLVGVTRLRPGHRWRLPDGEQVAWHRIGEGDGAEGLDEAVRRVDAAGRAAVAARVGPEPRVGLYLSGGLDSSAVAVWLRELGVRVHGFTLDLGAGGEDAAAAEAVGRHLGIQVTRVPVDGRAVGSLMEDLVWRMDVPFGDAVTGPHLLLARAARERGFKVVFNGEGGDQLFGGWTSKPMLASAVHGDGRDVDPYLRSYHKFLGSELLLDNTGLEDPGEVLEPWLYGGAARSWLHRIRLADLCVKGHDSLAPRADRLGAGLSVRMPFFDRALTELAFALAPSVKLRGSEEKAVLRRLLRGRLPDAVLERKKSGMGVPVTDWVCGPLLGRVWDLLGPEAVRRRGLFRPAAIADVLYGRDMPAETRRRRLGEKVWALMVLEVWFRVLLDDEERS